MNEIFKDIKEQYRYNDVSQKLIFWNIAIFILSLAMFFQFKLGIFSFPNYVALSSNPQQFIFFPWTFISYSFFHVDFLHLLSNMLFLFFAGRLFFTFFNANQFLATYFFGAIVSGIVYVLVQHFYFSDNQIVGASGAVLAVFFTVVFYSPLYLVRIPLVGIVKLWHIGFIILLLNVIYFAVENTGGHVAHLAGIGFGYLNLFLLKRGVDLSKLFVFKKSKKNTTFKKVYKTKSNVSAIPQIKEKDIIQKQIDDILDKISKSGYDSLTKEEKEFLFKVNQ